MNGVYTSDKINKFTAFNRMMKDGKYPSLIPNTDRSDKGAMLWWSILDIRSARDFLLLYTFGIDRLKNFIIQDDKKIVEKVIKGIKKWAEKTIN